MTHSRVLFVSAVIQHVKAVERGTQIMVNQKDNAKKLMAKIGMCLLTCNVSGLQHLKDWY